MIIRVAIAVTLTAVLVTAFFSYMHFEIYGEGEFCRQKYDLPAFSVYTDRLDCFVFLGDLAGKAGQIFVVLGTPLLLSGIATVWVGWMRRKAGENGPRYSPSSSVQAEPVDVASQAQLFFWILTVSLGSPLGIALALWVVGLSPVLVGKAVGAILFYGLHLCTAGMLAFGIVQAVSWLWHMVTMRLRRSP